MAEPRPPEDAWPAPEEFVALVDDDRWTPTVKGTLQLFSPLLVGLPVILGLAMISPLLAAPVYIVLFFAVAMKRVEAGLALVMFGAPFQQDIGGPLPVAVSIGELNLVLLGAVVLCKPRLKNRGFSGSPVVLTVWLYLLVCLLSSAVSWRGSVALVSIVQSMLYVVLAPWIVSRAVRDPRDIDMGLWALVIIGALLAVAIVTGGSSYVFGLHKNGAAASISCAVIAVGHLLFKHWENRKARQRIMVLVLILGLGLLLSVSRGAWMAAFVGVLIVMVGQQRVKLAIRTILYALPVLLVGWFLLPQEKREYAFGFEEERWNVRMRLESIEFAYTQFLKNPMLGVGVGLRKQYDATNLFLSTLAETGVLGVLAFGLVQLSVAAMLFSVWKRLGVRSAWAEMATVGVAIAMARLTHGMVDHYWSRGPLLLAWAGIGMLCAAWLVSRGKREDASLT